MSFQELSAMINSVMELGKAAVALKDVPDKQREHYREIIDETYSLLDSALMLIIRRLGDLLLIEETDKARFANELKRLDNYGEWEQLERDVRLCRPLRAASREMESIHTKLKDKISIKDRESLDHLIRYILREGEGSLANFISSSLYELSTKLDEACDRSEVYKRAIDAVHKTRDTLREERKRLIQSQVDFYNII